MTPIKFTLTQEDVLAGNQLAFRRSVRRGAPKFAIAIFVISLAISSFAHFSSSNPLSDFPLLFAKILGLYLAIGAVIMLLIVFYMPKQRAKKNFQQMPALRRPLTVSWDDSAIAFTTEYGNAIIPLADLHQWAANDELVIIYPGDHVFYMLPDRVLDDKADRVRLIAALEASLVKRI